MYISSYIFSESYKNNPIFQLPQNHIKNLLLRTINILNKTINNLIIFYRVIPKMRPIYLPVNRQPDTDYQTNGNISPEEPKIVTDDIPRVIVSNLISKFEIKSTLSPKKPSLVKSKSFSARGSKKQPRTNQTQDDALHNKSEAEVEEIRKFAVKDLRKKFEEVEDNNNNVFAADSEIKQQNASTPLANIAKIRLEHFKRLTKKWERTIAELLRHLTETADFDIYNVRLQDLEFSINRDLHGMQVKSEEIAPQELVTPQRKSPEIETLSHVAKITSMYEIKAKEKIEETPRTPIHTPKRLPWTSSRKEIKKEVEQQIEENENKVKEVEEPKPKEVVVEEEKTTKFENKDEEPSNLVDTEHLKSASLITSYFNSLSNVNNRNNETLNNHREKEVHTPPPSVEENSFDYYAPSSTLNTEESYKDLEPYETAQNVSNESNEEQGGKYIESLNESNHHNDSSIDREFEKYYSEDLKATKSTERLFDDYYRENVLEDANPEQTDEKDYTKYEEESTKDKNDSENLKLVNQEETENEEENGDNNIKYSVEGLREVEDKVTEQFQNENGFQDRVTKDIIVVEDPLQTDQIKSDVVQEENKIVEEKVEEKLEEADKEISENKMTKDLPPVDQIKSDIVQKDKNTVKEAISEELQKGNVQNEATERIVVTEDFPQTNQSESIIVQKDENIIRKEVEGENTKDFQDEVVENIVTAENLPQTEQKQFDIVQKQEDKTLKETAVEKLGEKAQEDIQSEVTENIVITDNFPQEQFDVVQKKENDTVEEVANEKSERKSEGYIQNNVIHDTIVLRNNSETNRLESNKPQKKEEIITENSANKKLEETGNEEAKLQCTVEEPTVVVSKQAESITENNQEGIITEEVASENILVASKTIKDDENELRVTENTEKLILEDKNIAGWSKAEESDENQLSTEESANNPLQENETIHIEELAPVIRSHQDDHQQLSTNSASDDGSCLKRYIMDTKDIIMNHEKASS